MTRYFFDIEDGDFKPDRLGAELPDDGLARHYAIGLMTAIVQGRPDPAERQNVRVFIRNREGEPVGEVGPGDI